MHRYLSEDAAYLLNLPYHLAYANMDDELCTLLTDFDFIDHKISTSTPQPLIEDYNLAIQPHIPQLAQNNLQLIQSAIQLSANILTEDGWPPRYVQNGTRCKVL